MCSFYHWPLRTSIKTNVNKFVISIYTALKLGIRALGSCFRLTCEYELHILSNTNGAAKDHGENYIKDRPSLVRHLWRNRLLRFNTFIIVKFMEDERKYHWAKTGVFMCFVFARIDPQASSPPPSIKIGPDVLEH